MQDVQSRRDLLISAALAGGVLAFPRYARALARAHRETLDRATLRPPPNQRTFSSPAVEETLHRVKSRMADPELARRLGAAARAYARAIAAEMHAGFMPLRRHCPMNMWRSVKVRELPPEVAADVKRIEAIFTECRERFGQGGAFLFGAFGAADAMYAPVVSRLHTYDIAVGPVVEAYKQAMMALPAWTEWRAAALKEPWVMANAEVDWPVVLRE